MKNDKPLFRCYTGTGVLFYFQEVFYMELYERVVCYKAAMVLFDKLYQEGCISKEEYLRIESEVAKKYTLSDKSIFRNVLDFFGD